MRSGFLPIARVTALLMLAGCCVGCNESTSSPVDVGVPARSASSAPTSQPDKSSGSALQPEATVPPNPSAAPGDEKATQSGDSTVAQLQEAHVLPNPKLTPGDTLPATKADVCTPGYSESVRYVSSAVKRQVYVEYGIMHHGRREYEVDHLISLELGGSNEIANLWPESYRTQPWNAERKDRLENELHHEVCGGEIELKDAQQEISRNWTESYRKHFHEDPSTGVENTGQDR